MTKTAECEETKTDKNTASVFRVFDLLFIHTKPYENEFSTALSDCKAVARCATRKTDTAINRIKTVGTYKVRIENTYGRKQNKNQWGMQNCGHHFKEFYHHTFHINF